MFEVTKKCALFNMNLINTYQNVFIYMIITRLRRFPANNKYSVGVFIFVKIREIKIIYKKKNLNVAQNFINLVFELIISSYKMYINNQILINECLCNFIVSFSIFFDFSVSHTNLKSIFSSILMFYFVQTLLFHFWHRSKYTYMKIYIYIGYI